MKRAKIAIEMTVTVLVSGLVWVGYMLLDRPSNPLEWGGAVTLLVVMMVGHKHSMRWLTAWAVRRYAYLRLVRALRRSANEAAGDATPSA